MSTHINARHANLALLLIIAALANGCAPSPHDLAGKKDGHTELEAMLAENPEAVSATNHMGKTPLHYAVTYGRDEAIQLLLDHGADSNAHDNSGMTPLHCAATLNRIDEAELLLAGGADLEQTDSFGDTPLHSAAMHGQVKMINWLARKGANLNAANNQDKTPEDLARRERKTEAQERLTALAARAK